MQLSPQAAARLLRAEREPAQVEERTPRETEVLQLIAQGLINKESALELGIGEKTEKTHVSNILGKLGVRSWTRAAVYAVQIGRVCNLSAGVE